MKPFTVIEQRVYDAIKAEPGITGAQLLTQVQVPESVLYGRQRPISSAIASLRSRGYVSDVSRRCDHCGSALTRGDRNVPLTVLK